MNEVNNTGVVITRDDLSPLLARIKDSVAAQGMSLVMARGVGILVKDHLVALNAERHKYGRNYYARAARSVTTGAAAGFAYVSINQIGIRQRLNGGRITAGQSGSDAIFLTIPACPEAYGMRAREFHDLQLGRAMNPAGRLQWCLMQRASTAISITRRKRKDGSIKTTVRAGEFNAGGKIMFWLAHSIYQKEDPTVLPTQAEMLAAAIGAGEARLTRLQNSNGGKN